MKNYIIIFCKTPYSKTPYDQWLKEYNITPLILTSTELADGYKDIQHVFSFDNYDYNQNVLLQAYELAKTFNVFSVFARAEVDVIRAAQLRELFGIQGQKVPSALAYRNKVIMKDYLKNSEINLPSYQRLESPLTLFQFIQSHGYPVVAKPVAESGSTGTWIIKNSDDLKKFLSEKHPYEMEVETFVDGYMCHIDGLKRNNEVIFLQASKYINNCLSFRDHEFCGSVTIDRYTELHHQLAETTQKILELLPKSENMAFHCELWVQPSGKIVFCEIASRTGGAIVSAIIEETFGLNIDREWLYAECGISSQYVPGDYRAGGGVWIPPKIGRLEYLPIGDEPVCVRNKSYHGKVGEVYNGGVKSGLYLAGFVVGGDDEHEVQKNVLAVAGWFKEKTIWNEQI